jgi:hypothetical protein
MDRSFQTYMTPAGIPGVTTEPSETGMRSRRSHRMHPKAKLSIRRGPEFGFQCWRHKGSPTKIQGEPLLASADRWSAMLRSFLPGYSIKRIVMSTCAGFLSISATEPAVQALAGERKTEFLLPSRAVDTHVHIFDPSGHPYAATRSYSPSAAVLSELLDFTSRFTRNGLPSTVVLVQPSPYGTDNRLLCHSLEMCHRQGLPLARGIAVIDPATTPDSELQQLHQYGVRGVRIVCGRCGPPR